ncbi:MAG: efflux RND transporter permease subunit, partial [Proteobacteria bacterium]|nr:efflux RND transporter permease subunit [Pseudomonadota bacterium]
MGSSILAIFARHPVAANLLMAMMMISGVWGLSQLNTQFFPSFDIDFVSVKVTWPGASSEDLETLVTEPLERQLKGTENVKELKSLSVDGQTFIPLEFRENTDMGPALDDVKERVDLVSNLPDGAETPEISRV